MLSPIEVAGPRSGRMVAARVAGCGAIVPVGTPSFAGLAQCSLLCPFRARCRDAGGYRTKSKEQKAAIKEKEAAIFAAVKAGDKAALKTSYAAFIKEGEVINPFGCVPFAI